VNRRLCWFVAAAVVTVTVMSCRSASDTCDLVEHVRLTIPDTTTIEIGANAIAIGGESYGCGQRPARDYVWTVSDSSAVAVAALDAIQARITGLHAGTAVVTPVYRAGGGALLPVRVTVVP
jgi:hypothetical protein